MVEDRDFVIGPLSVKPINQQDTPLPVLAFLQQ